MHWVLYTAVLAKQVRQQCAQYLQQLEPEVVGSVLAGLQGVSLAQCYR